MACIVVTFIPTSELIVYYDSSGDKLPPETADRIVGLL